MKHDAKPVASWLPTDPHGALDEPRRQLDLPLPRLPARTNGARMLWLLAATPEESRQLARHLSLQSAHHSVFVSVRDGSSAIRPGDLVAIKIGEELELFSSASEGDEAAQRELAQHILRLMRGMDVVRRTEQWTTDLLFVRLWGNGRAVTASGAPDGRLAQFLSLIQEADQSRRAQFVSDLAGSLLDARPSGIAASLDGLLMRLKARALFEMCRTLHGYSSEAFAEARQLYSHASRAFAQGGAHGHAAACDRWHRGLVEVAASEPDVQPCFPGLGLDAHKAVSLPRLGFRALRCVAIPLELRLPVAQPLSLRRPVEAMALQSIGKVAISARVLLAILSSARSDSLVPSVSVSRAGESRLAKRIHVAVQQEHFALLGVGDRHRRPGGGRFEVHLGGRGWDVPVRSAMLGAGMSKSFHAVAASGDTAALEVLLSDGNQTGRFEVSPLD